MELHGVAVGGGGSGSRAGTYFGTAASETVGGDGNSTGSCGGAGTPPGKRYY